MLCCVQTENAKHADLGLEHDSNMVRTCIEHVFEACGQAYLGSVSRFRIYAGKVNSKASQVYNVTGRFF